MRHPFPISSHQFKRLHHHHLLAFFSTAAHVFEKCNSLSKVKLHHQQLTVNGLAASNPTVLPKIIGMYISCDAPSHALLTLSRLPPSPSSVYWWNSLIRRAVRLRLLDHALEHYRDMQSLGWRPDGYTFPFLLKACGELPSFRRGASFHGIICILGYENNVFVGNALVAMYGRCGDLDAARQVFDEMIHKEIADVVSWNSIVATYMQSGDSKKAVQMFYRMTSRQLRADAVSLVNILPAIASVLATIQGKEAHAYALKTNLTVDLFVSNAIIDMYAKCGLMDEANKVFHRMESKDVVTWNAMVTGHSQIGRFDDALGLFEKMREEKIELNVVTWSAVIAGYAQRGRGREALNIFRQMINSGSKPNVVTIISLLSGCACAGTLLHGKEIHSYIIKNIYDHGDEQMLINSLIDMYAKCKSGHLALILNHSKMSKYPRNQGNRSTSGNGWANRANVGPGPRPGWKPKQKVDLDGSLGTASSSQKVDSSARAECISGNAPSSTPKPDSDIHLQEEPPLPPVKNAASGMENLKQIQDPSQRADNHSKQQKSVSNSDYGSKDLKHMNPITRKSQQGRVSDGYFTPTKRIPVSFSPMQNGIPEKGKQSVDQDNSGKLEDTDHPSSITPFDICPIKANSFVKVKPPLHALNREKRNQLKHSVEGPIINILRPGMVLMKGYISPDDQVNIVKTCRDLGIGDGDFYQPGYRDGAKLHLRMMCLGMDWDPQSSKYNDTRQFDNSKPPGIPNKFHELVKRALQVSNAHIQKNKGKMIPDILL